MENEELKIKILDIITELFPNLIEIDDILKREFSEESVDFIDYTIRLITELAESTESVFNDEEIKELVKNKIADAAMIKFPVVDITNERDEKIRIYDLFVKIPITENGTLTTSKFTMMRSTYTKMQYTSHYCHSHIPSIYNFTDATEFKIPCLGRGPINNTIHTLQGNFSSDMWSLFAYELKLYVQTESLKGGPFVRMSTVSGKTNYKSISNIAISVRDTLDLFIKWVCENNILNLKFGFGKEGFKIGESDINAIVKVSELFFKWHKEAVTSTKDTKVFGILEYITPCIIQGNEIYKYYMDSSTPVRGFIQDHPLFSFRGETVKMRLIDDSDETPNITPLLKYEYFCYIVNKFIIILNIYGNRKECFEESSDGESVKIVF